MALVQRYADKLHIERCVQGCHDKAGALRTSPTPMGSAWTRSASSATTSSTSPPWTAPASRSAPADAHGAVLAAADLVTAAGAARARYARSGPRACSRRAEADRAQHRQASRTSLRGSLVRSGVRHVFMLVGGAAMHLNDAIGACEDLAYVCNLHEQACAIAAEAYAKYDNRLGVAVVTAGPGRDEHHHRRGRRLAGLNARCWSSPVRSSVPTSRAFGRAQHGAAGTGHADDRLVHHEVRCHGHRPSQHPLPP